MRNISAAGIVAVLASTVLAAMPVTGQAQQAETPVELFKKADELQSAGRYAEAIPYARQALEIEERVSGLNHPNVGNILNYLALLHYRRGSYADAEPLFQRSLAIVEKAFGPNHPDVGTSLNNLASLYDTKVVMPTPNPCFSGHWQS
jgi:tetratricopeptide (TPR) repeat protein